jgi:hypothetical protein
MKTYEDLEFMIAVRGALLAGGISADVMARLTDRAALFVLEHEILCAIAGSGETDRDEKMKSELVARLGNRPAFTEMVEAVIQDQTH